MILRQTRLTQYGRSKKSQPCKPAPSLLKASMLVSLIAAGLPALAEETGVYQMYYVPAPEDVVTDFNNTVNSAGNDIRTVLSISVILNGTLIWYDQSEDGMEGFLTDPAQMTTGIWGDGDPANGFPPGFPADELSAGDVIVLDETYNVTTTGSCSYADDTGTDCRLNGGDRFGSNKALAVTRAAWNTSPGSVLAGAVEMESQAYWDTDFVLPLGEDTASTFDTTWAIITAGEDDTDVQLNGGTAVTLQAGETHVFENTFSNDVVSASAPVQLMLLTGTTASWESRWYRVSPTAQWVNEYYSPVGTTNSTPVSYHLFNPDINDITVDIEYSPGNVDSLLVPGESTAAYTNATSSGLHFQSTGGEPFYVMGTVDDGSTHDWGFSLVPAAGLTGQTVLGWAPGTENLSDDDNSPAWVTAVDNTTICVDFDRDGAIDLAQPLNRLEMLRLTDSSDNDMTGALVYSINDGNSDNAPNACYSNGNDDTQTDIAIIWGQDPAASTSGFPSLDLGTTVLSVPKYAVSKRAELFIDADSSGNTTPGDTIRYIIEVDNYGALPLNNAHLTDNMPPELTYAPDHSDPWDCSAFPVCEIGPFSVAPFNSESFLLAATIPSDGGTETVASNIAVLDPGTGDTPSSGGTDVSIAYADVTTTLDFPTVAEPGSALTGYVNFGNVGTMSAEDTTYQVQLPVGLSDVGCAGATCNYNATTGIITMTGLPTSLSPGQWTDAVALSFTTPTGTPDIDIVSTIDTSSLQPISHEPDSDNTSIPLEATGGSTEVDVISRVNPPATAAPGSTVTVPVSYTNFGPAQATNIDYSLSLPPGLAGVSCNGASCNYNAVTGEITVSGIPTSLAAGESLGFDLVYTAPASGTVMSSSDISTGDEIPANTGNNPDSKPTVISDSVTADVSTAVSPPPSVDAGETVSVPVSYSNVGASDATGVSYNLQLTNSPADIAVSYEGTPCTYDTLTGDISGCGLPGTLVPGQTLDLLLAYTAPPSDPVVITSAIGTASDETFLLNNTAQAQSAVNSLPAAKPAPIPAVGPLGMLLTALMMLGTAWRRRLLQS